MLFLETRRAMSDLGQTLERFREYLRLLARLQPGADLAGKVDLAGVVQQVLLEAFQAGDRFPSQPDQQAAWLRRALAHNLTDEVRKLRTRGRVPVRLQSLEQALEDSSARLEGWLARADSTPSRHAVRQEQLTRLAEAFARLPDDQRQAVELHHLHGLSLADVGERLGRSREAVAGLVFRGMALSRDGRLLVAAVAALEPGGPSSLLLWRAGTDGL
jgi:RNA polymerase sigma-70 factor (ECF subfamily)